MINKVTRLQAPTGGSLTDAMIQEHIDEQNALGFELVAVDNLVGWYRFFWKKEEIE